MAKLTSAKRGKLKSSSFALPGSRRFPLNDVTHEREAIPGATRSYRAGNISASTEARIKAEARAKLARGKTKGVLY